MADWVSWYVWKLAAPCYGRWQAGAVAQDHRSLIIDKDSATVVIDVPSVHVPRKTTIVTTAVYVRSARACRPTRTIRREDGIPSDRPQWDSNWGAPTISVCRERFPARQ